MMGSRGKMKCFVLFLISFSVCLLPCEGQLDGHFWWLKTDTATKSTTTSTTTTTEGPALLEIRKNVVEEIICCECVSYFNCVDGVISTDGAGVIDLRFGPSKPMTNVDRCPGLDICCIPPNVDPSCKDRSDELYGPILPSDTLCGCVVYDQCDPGLVVSDNRGNTSIELGNGRLVSHSLCHHSLDVCCYIPPPPPPLPSIPPTDTSDCECVAFYLCGDDGFIITDGRGAIDSRFGASLTSSTPKPSCIDDPSLVCCRPRPPIVDVVNTTPVTDVITDDPLCVCVPFYICGNDGFVITDGSGGLLDPRIGGNTVLKRCSADPSLVCCYNRPDVVSEVTPITDRPYTQTPTPITDRPYTPTPTPITPIYRHDCQCVHHYLCDSDGYIITSGAGIIDLIGNSYHELCPGNDGLVCCHYRNETTTETPRLPYRPVDTCGVRNSVGVGTRILGLTDGQTQFGEFPWMVTLLRREIISEKYYPLFEGGASLIHRRVVLTAAHKVRKYTAADMFIRLGEWDVGSEKEPHKHQDVNITNIIIHPKFNPHSLAHDVALLILDEDAKIDYHIQTICLVKDLSEIDQTDCVSNGWGVDKHMIGDYQLVLKKVELPLVPKKKCQNFLRKTRLSPYFVLDPSFLCAGGEEGADTCKGDGGGPLACRVRDDPTRYLQVGITAWGIGCGGKDVPGVYVDIPFHYSWILDTIQHYIKEPQIHSTDVSEISLKAERRRQRRARKNKRKRNNERRSRNGRNNRNKNGRNEEE